MIFIKHHVKMYDQRAMIFSDNAMTYVHAPSR